MKKNYGLKFLSVKDRITTKPQIVKCEGIYYVNVHVYKIYDINTLVFDIQRILVPMQKTLNVLIIIIYLTIL